MFMPILALYNEEEAKSRIRESMERDGSFRGYLFQCRHCKEYLLYADYD
ncbi:CbrC family protein [Paenibacillus polymyxa]|uniref:CbrC family protein n=1 Tax=Paenibacillus polymyxa TaxID=1406 RepID=A0A8I1IWZ6_PAEPO|nr:CbrC family protein [Paenibacillus polymyxa]